MLTLTGVDRSYASALDSAVRDLTVRAEVGSTMESMLGDLEAWEWANREEALTKDLQNAQAHISALQESERRLLEREAQALAKHEEDKASARDVRSKFVQELWGLAREFRLREQEQGKADQLSKKLARLEGVEAELREAESKLAKLQSAYHVVIAATTPAGATPGTGRGLEAVGNADTSASSHALARSTEQAITPPTAHGPELSPEIDPVGGLGAASSNEGTPKTAPSVLMGLEKKPLLKVFVFLNAGEVLRAAQVCRAMFQKVDLMFGIGSQGGPQEPTPAPETSMLDRRASTGNGSVDSAVVGGVDRRSRAGSTTSVSSASPPTGQAGGTRLGQRALVNALGVVVSRVEAVTAGASGGLGNLAGAAASLASGGGGVGGGNDGLKPGGEGGVSQEFVDGLSKRLTTGEMKGIIQLTERSRKLEATASALRAEKEDLFARLQGTESVKEFLVTKLKDTEAALKRSLDEKGLTLRQSASDQEVISFLDSRTQEMEKVARETMDKAVTYQNELETQKLNGQKQTKVLEDMLRFERQRKEAEEAAFKAQKKLLVAEVKKLRTANLALKAECDDLRQQLKDLRVSVSQLGR